jgi:hypothetical protein
MIKLLILNDLFCSNYRHIFKWLLVCGKSMVYELPSIVGKLELTTIVLTGKEAL